MSSYEKNIKKINDWDITHGAYRILDCQWDIENKNRCNQPVIPSKSYCEEHYKKIYRSISEDQADQEFEKITKEIKEDDIPLLILLEDETDA